ncbi:MAG: peptide deformylase, partial [Planctomycetes bacterium]|nr:peptide deformylase [Planctomycetota bacterium]
SFPGIYGEIERPERCTVEAFDVKGNPIRQEFGGFQSRIIQHEYDHLEGILLVDRLSQADKLRNKGELQELVDRYRAERA